MLGFGAKPSFTAQESHGEHKSGARRGAETKSPEVMLNLFVSASSSL
jgi:hypothetical protein